MFGAAPGELRRDGGGWSDGERSVAEVRQIAGRNHELVVDERWLREWLDSQTLALVWIEVSGKDVYTKGRGSPGRLLRTRVSSLGTDRIETLPPVHERFPTYDGT